MAPETMSSSHTAGLELAAKLSPKRLPEIRDRALKALGSKLELGILPPEVALEIPGLPQLVLHWLNDRQDSEPELLNVALKLLGRLAHGQDTTRLHEAGCIPFLQDFRPQVPPPCLETLDAALWALLCHRPEAAEKEGSGDAFSTPLKRRKEPFTMVLTPAKSASKTSLRSLETLKLPELQIGEADQQILLDMAVRLKFSDASQRPAACRELWQLAVDMPRLLLTYAPVVEGLCLCLRESENTAACDVLCLLLEQEKEHRRQSPAAEAEEALPALWHLLAQLLSSGVVESPLAQHALRALLQLLHLEPGEGKNEASMKQCRNAQQMLHCIYLVSELLRSLLALRRQALRCAAEALDWFRCLGLPKAHAAEKLPWFEPLPSHDWTPETLLLIDVLLGLLQGVMTCSNAEELLSSWARENEVLAAMVSSLVFDLRLLWERPWQCAELLSRAVALWAPQQAKEFSIFQQMLQEGETPDAGIKNLGEESDEAPGREAALCQAAQLLQVGLREQIFITGMRERSVVRLRSECREELQKALSEGLAALTMWQGGGSLVLGFQDEEQVTGLEMMYHLLRELPDLQNTLSETMEIKETITELEQLMHQRLLPGLYQLVEDDWGPRGRLADPELLRATQLLLRMALALRVFRREEHLESMDWLQLLSVLALAPAPVPRLALSLAVWLPTDAADAEGRHFGEVLLELLSARQNTTTWRNAQEIRCALWLAADLAPPEAVAYITPFLQHVDAVVVATAWRCLRCLLFRDETDEETPLQRRATLGRALRALRGWSREEKSCAEQFALPVAEALETVRWILEAGEPLVMQVLEPRIFESGLFQKSFSSSHLGLRRSALRLLSALLAADFPQSVPAIFKAGLWTSALAAAEVEEQSLDSCTVTTDLVLLVMQGSGEDSQLLLWLCKSTSFLQDWQHVLQYLGTFAKKAEVQGDRTSRLAELLRLHLVALLRLMELWEEDFQDFLFSWQVQLALCEALQADFPAETRHVATAALASWAGRRVNRVTQETMTSDDELLGHRAAQGFLRVLSSDSQAKWLTTSAAAAANLYAASPLAASGAISELPQLSRALEQLAAMRRHQQLIWVMRVFFAMLISSADALAGAHAGGSLASALLAIRASADRDEAVCLEFLEQLSKLAEALVQLKDEEVWSQLLSWLMRLSMKKQLPSAAFCCVMDILCLSSEILAGKPMLFRYLSQLMEAIQSLSKTSSSMSSRWRSKRLCAAMNFIASIQMCPRSTAILTGSGAAGEVRRRHLSAPLEAGLDLWFDLTAQGELHSMVRFAALRVLLALSEAMPKASVEAWPRWPMLQRSGRRWDLREGLLQLLAEEDWRAAALCEAE